jgi:hypothetical protein
LNADDRRRTRRRAPLRRPFAQSPTPGRAQRIRLLEGEVLPWFEARKKELANRPLIREQAFGESLDPDKSGLDFTQG